MQEEEELNLAIALSQSEAEHQEKEKKRGNRAAKINPPNTRVVRTSSPPPSPVCLQKHKLKKNICIRCFFYLAKFL